MMLPKIESIFNIGEEMVEEEPNKSRVLTTSTDQAPESRLVGLRILIEHHRRAANVVTKSTLKSCGGGPPRRPPRSLPELGFLKACIFCKKELSLEKDVYMYRGDQGFCSVECRCQQILLDERREFEASKIEWQRMQHHRHNNMPKIRESNQMKRITIRF